MNNLITTWQTGRFIDHKRYSRWTEKEKAEADLEERCRVRPHPEGNAIAKCFTCAEAEWIASRLNLAAVVDQVPGLSDVLEELKKAISKFPTWPDDPLHALAVLGEEFGELTKEVVETTYEPEKTTPDALRKEAIQTAAMALRFVGSLDTYRPARSRQHVQGEPRKVGCALCDRGDGQMGHSDECPNRY